MHRILNRLSLLTVSLCLALPACAAPEGTKTTSENRVKTEMTVYNSNLALIRETRRMKLESGKSTLEWSKMPFGIIAESVRLETPPGTDLAIHEQNYDFDLISSNALLEASIGKKLRIVDWNKYQDRKETIEAVLLSAGPVPVYRVGEEIYIDPPGTKVLPAMPEGFQTEPKLSWLCETSSGRETDLSATYLTGGFSWKSDYALTLDESGSAGNLAAWASIENRSGTDFDDAELTLVAGSVNRAPPSPAPRMMKAVMLNEAAGADHAFAQESAFSEYHAYALPGKVSLKKNQTKQVPLFKPLTLPVERIYVIDQGGPQLYNPWNVSKRDAQVPVRAELRFRNPADRPKGTPLPAGTLRVFENDASGKTRFSGEDRIGHTPVGEEIKTRLGTAFDLAAERKQTNYRRITQKMHESSWEIAIRNQKNRDVNVEVIEQLGNNWKILQRSHAYQAEDAFRVKFDVPVKAKSEARLTYTVQVGY